MALRFSGHAPRRMFQRSVSVDEVREAVEGGEVIEAYPDDKPYPSRLILAVGLAGPLHVVVADGPEGPVVVTAYRPDRALWTGDFRRRR